MSRAFRSIKPRPRPGPRIQTKPNPFVDKSVEVGLGLLLKTPICEIEAPTDAITGPKIKARATCLIMLGPQAYFGPGWVRPIESGCPYLVLLKDGPCDYCEIPPLGISIPKLKRTCLVRHTFN